MKRSFYFAFILVFNLLPLSAQENINEPPNEVRKVLHSLQGEFNWKIIRPSEEKVLRTGTKRADFELDSLVLLSRETFDDSNIKQMGIMGYNPKDSVFFSVGLYNIEIGPNMSKGNFHQDYQTIRFMSNDSSRRDLNIESRDRYYWTYENLVENEWKPRDLKIVFERK